MSNVVLRSIIEWRVWNYHVDEDKGVIDMHSLFVIPGSVWEIFYVEYYVITLFEQIHAEYK